MASTAVHPGEVLAEKLRALGVSPTELARLIAVPPNRVTQIIHGRRGITGDTALRLGHWFENSAQYWLSLQNEFDIELAQQKAGADIARLPTVAKGEGQREASTTRHAGASARSRRA